MSYNTGYGGGQAYGGQQYGQPYQGQTYQSPYAPQNYSSSQYPTHGERYDAPLPPDPETTGYDPYTRAAHPTYDQSGFHDAEYDDDAYARGTGAGAGGSREEPEVKGERDKERSRYDETFPPVLRPPKYEFYLLQDLVA